MKHSSPLRSVLSYALVALTVMSCSARNQSDVVAPISLGEADIHHTPDQLVTIPADMPSQILIYPGFMLSHNSEHHQPNWVFWELTADEVASDETSRNKSNFIADPAADGGAELADYKGSGWSRGHMCPAADMKWSQQAMDACFQLSNICPQANELNSGAWNSLEVKCRQWATRDSAIYIICGPVLTDKMLRTIGDNEVTVPERFFKVILAPYADPPRAIGFVMPNGKVNGGMNATAMSVDEVELITGYDFFPYLPDEIEQKIESQCNLQLWNKRR